MKIISKHKDYFFYLKGIYGEDPLLILDVRKSFSIPYIPTDYTISILYIGDYEIQGMWKNGIIYYGKDIEQFALKPSKYLSFHDEKKYYLIPSWNEQRHQEILKEPINHGDNCPTWKENCPLLIDEYNDCYIHNPILKEYNVQKVFDAHKVWLILTEWLSKQLTKKEPIQPVGDDIVRLQAAGFDKKTSFRK